MPTPEREDVAAAIEARRELGEELEPQVVDAFVARIEKQIEARARELADVRQPTRRQPDWSAFALAICTIGIAVPNVENTVLAAIVAVNLAYNFRR